MRVLLQRVSSAGVTVDGEQIASIDIGLLALVGFTSTDTSEIAEQFATKCANLRVFDDAEGVMNCSLLDRLRVSQPAAMLAVSQFTLYADSRKGRRPSYVNAARPEIALPLFDTFVATVASLSIPVQTGRFGAEMAVALVNDGPVTIWLDSDDVRRGV